MVNGYQADYSTEALVHILAENTMSNSAMTLARRYHREQQTLQSAIILAHAHAYQQEYQQAFRLIRSRAKALSDRDLAEYLIDFAIDIRDPDQAETYIKQFIQEFPDYFYVWHQAGHYFAQQEQYSQAQYYFSQALALNPSNTNTQDYLLHINGQLGEGSKIGIRDDLEAVPLPVDIQQRYAQPIESETSSPYHIRHASLAISFNPERHYRETERTVYAIHHLDALEDLAELSVDYDPFYESIAINEVSVSNSLGETIWVASPGSYYQLDSGGNISAGHDKTIYIPIDQLNVGHCLHLTTTKEYSSTPDDLPFQLWYGQWYQPCDETMLWCEAPQDQIAFTAHQDFNQQQFANGMLWRVDHPQKYRRESYAAHVSITSPTVYLGSPQQDWQTLVNNYLDDIDELLNLWFTRG